MKRSGIHALKSSIGGCDPLLLLSPDGDHVFQESEKALMNPRTNIYAQSSQKAPPPPFSFA